MKGPRQLNGLARREHSRNEAHETNADGEP